jgi:hypothetical protein
MGNIADDSEAAEARRLLQEVDAGSLITDDLRTRVRNTFEEIMALTDEAETLRRRVEDLHTRVEALDNEHIRLLETRFPEGIPCVQRVEGPDVVGPFDEMTGNDKVFPAFHELVRLMHNTLPKYPHETRDDAEEIRRMYERMYRPWSPSI